MKGLMKKMVGAALALAFALGTVPVHAENEKASPFQGGNFGGIHENLDFYGAIPCRITASTTAVLCKSGEGFLDAVCPSGGVSPQYSLGLDSGIATSRSVTNSDSYVITPIVFSRIDTNSSPGGKHCFSAKDEMGGPVRFVNGLVGVQSAATGTTLLYWHHSDGSNP